MPASENWRVELIVPKTKTRSALWGIFRGRNLQSLRETKREASAEMRRRRRVANLRRSV